MNKSPFVYGTTVSSESFTDREIESKKLYTNLMGGINTTIISPRRWGKSSLVEKVIGEIKKNETKVKIINIDLFGVSGFEEFLEIYAREVIKVSSGKWEDWVNAGKEFFKIVIPRINLGVDPINDFNLSFNWDDIKKEEGEILNLPEKIADKKKIRYIICLDEFQNLANFKGYEIFEKKLRANWQRHKLVTYCLYGSKRHMMSEIFNNSSKPLYRFGDIMTLGKISENDWTKFILEQFSKTGIEISMEDACSIPKLMKNHSWYVQQLSHYVWQNSGKKAGKNEIQAALNELINANSPLYQKEVESISSTQLNLLKAVAHGETQLTSNAVMQKYKLGTPRNVLKNKDILINSDMIHLDDGIPEFLDPAFELWFLKQFNGKDYSQLL